MFREGTRKGGGPLFAREKTRACIENVGGLPLSSLLRLQLSRINAGVRTCSFVSSLPLILSPFPLCLSLFLSSFSVIRSSKPLPFRHYSFAVFDDHCALRFVRSAQPLVFQAEDSSSDLSKVNDAWKFQRCAG